MGPTFRRAMVEAQSDRWALEARLEDTPRWRVRERAEVRRDLAASRRHEQQALYMLGGDVSWPLEYWPGR